MSHLSRVARDDTSHHNTYYAAIGQQVVFNLMKQVMSIKVHMKLNVAIKSK